MNNPSDRARLMASLMNNKAVAKAFSDAMKAPIGSTKREKARRLISVLHKTVAKHDGMGGPGYGMRPAAAPVGALPPMPVPARGQPAAREIAVFSAPPVPAADALGNPRFDGRGGSGYTPSPLGVNPFALPVGGALPQFSGLGAGLSITPSGTIAASTPPSASSNLLHTSGAQPAASTPFSVTYTNPAKLNITNPLATANFSYAQPGQPFATPGVPSPAPTEIWQQTQARLRALGAAKQVPSTAGAPPTVSGAPSSTAQPSAIRPPTGQTPPPSVPQPEVGQFKDLLSAAKSAVAGGTGPSTFAYGAMNDINILRELMPGVPDDNLPVGASLSGQINSLSDTLKKEYNIDTLQNQLNAKIRQGVTVEEDLKDYIRGKDEYLNGIDSMLGDAQNRAIELAGGPSAGIMSSYINYLTALKGRQNKRYIEFYNGAITQYNNELQGIQNNVNSALTNFQEELKTEATLKQDDYNRLFAGLTEMYNTVAAAPQKALEMKILQEQLNQARGGAATTGISAISLDWVKEYGTMKANNILFDEKTGKLQPQVQSLEPAIETIMSNGNTDIGGAHRMIGGAIANDLAYDTTMGDFSSYISRVTKYENMLTDYAREAMSPNFQAKYGVDVTPAISNIATNLASRVGESVASQILKEPGTYKDAMEDLISPGWWGRGKRQSRDQFITAHKDVSRPTSILEKMYDFYTVLQEADPRGTTTQNLLKMSDEEFARTLSEGIGKTFFTGPAALSSLSS